MTGHAISSPLSACLLPQANTIGEPTRKWAGGQIVDGVEIPLESAMIVFIVIIGSALTVAVRRDRALLTLFAGAVLMGWPRSPCCLAPDRDAHLQA